MPDHISSGIMIDEGLVEAGRLHFVGVIDTKKFYTPILSIATTQY